MLTDTVTINYSVDLRLVSDLVGAPVDEIEALNPSLLRMDTPPDTSFDLHLPAGTATLFNERIALIPEDKRNSWRYHAVAAGDTLASVAREYRVEPVGAGHSQSTARERQPRGRRGAGRSGSSVACALCAHAALHRAQGRYAGHHRRPIRRLAQPIAPLEQR